MRKLLSGILILILLVVTVGVPISRHTCYVFGKSELSLLTQKQCCDPGDRQNGTTIDFKCCSLEQFDTAFDYETLVDKTPVKIVLFAVELPQTFNVALDVVKAVEPLPNLRPPPQANRDILNAYQVYII